MSDRPKSLFKAQREVAKQAVPSSSPSHVPLPAAVVQPKGVEAAKAAVPLGVANHAASLDLGLKASTAPIQSPKAPNPTIKPAQREQPARVGVRPVEDVKSKVERYEKFLDENLRVKLKSIHEQRGEIVKEIEAYEKLGSTLKLVQAEGMKSMKASVNVGCDMYMQAIIPDASKVIVDVGLGFFVEMTVEEGLAFVDKKVVLLQRGVDSKSAEAAEVSSQIDVVLQGIAEILTLSPSAPRARTFM